MLIGVISYINKCILKLLRALSPVSGVTGRLASDNSTELIIAINLNFMKFFGF